MPLAGLEGNPLPLGAWSGPGWQGGDGYLSHRRRGLVGRGKALETVPGQTWVDVMLRLHGEGKGEEGRSVCMDLNCCLHCRMMRTNVLIPLWARSPPYLVRPPWAVAAEALALNGRTPEEAISDFLLSVRRLIEDGPD